MSEIATRTFRVALNAAEAARVVGGDGSSTTGPAIQVKSISVVDTAGARLVTYTDNDATALGDIAVSAANEFAIDETCWFADNGLKLPSGVATTLVTVRYRPTG